MKMFFLILALAATPAVYGSDCTALVSTQGAIVTIEKAAMPTPAPQSAPGAATVGGPIDVYRNARDLIDKGNDLADRGKAILDQAQRDGKITVDIRLPATPSSTCPQGWTCNGNSCTRTRDTTKLPDMPSSATSSCHGDCPNGVCPADAGVRQKPSEASDAEDATTDGHVRSVRRLCRWRR